MALCRIDGFFNAQNTSLDNIHVGDLVLVQQARPHTDPDDYSDSGDDESGHDSSEHAAEDNYDEYSNSGDDQNAFGGYQQAAVDHSSTSSSNQQAAQDTQHFQPTLFVVTKVVNNESGHVEDLRLKSVEHVERPANDRSVSFSLYGKSCVINIPFIPKDKDTFSIRELPTRSYLTFTRDPDGDLIRRVIFSQDCPASCDEGWLKSIHDLHGMVKNYTITSSSTHERPVCPSCVGIALMKEHQDLRAELETFHRVADFSAIVDFYSRLAVRRRELGYEYEQFDERNWGYLFDDMLSEDEARDGGDDGQYEAWDEATDPSNSAVLHPASEATIKALPILKYAKVKKDDGARCTICCDAFKDDQEVMQLPCKHFFCADGCLEQWLRQFDNCPNCRAKIPAVEESKPHHRGIEEDGADESGAQRQTGGSFVDGDGDVLMADTVVTW